MIRLRGVGKQFDGRWAFRGAELTVAPREIRPERAVDQNHRCTHGTCRPSAAITGVHTVQRRTR